MSYLKIVSYVYLAVAAFFIYDGIMRVLAGENYVISFLFAALAIFMFFFRMKFAKKFQNKKEN